MDVWSKWGWTVLHTAATKGYLEIRVAVVHHDAVTNVRQESLFDFVAPRAMPGISPGYGGLTEYWGVAWRGVACYLRTRTNQDGTSFKIHR